MRLFVAVWPPPDVIAALEALPRPPQPGLRWTTPDQWHVTLRFLGEVADPQPIADTLGRTDLPAAQAVLGPEVVRVGAAVAALPVSGLDRLAAVVIAATAAFGAPPPRRRFRGHLTVARARRGRPDTGALTLAATWPVEAVDVVRSHLAPTGARYESVAIVPVPT